MELNEQIYGAGVHMSTYGGNDFKCASNSDGTLARTIKELHTDGKISLNQHIDPSVSYCYSYGSKLCSYAYVMPTLREAPPDVQRHENPFANYFFMSDYGYDPDSNYTYYMRPQYADRIGYDMPEGTTLNGFSRWLYTRYALARIRFCCYVDYYTVTRTGEAHVAVYVGGGQLPLKDFLDDATLQQKYNNNELVVWRLTWRAYVKNTPDAIQGSYNLHFKIGSLVDMAAPVNDAYLTTDVYMYDKQLEIIQGGQTTLDTPSNVYNYNYLFTNTSNRWNFETLGYSGSSNVRVIATLPPENLLDAFHEFAFTGLFYTNNTTTAANTTLKDDNLFWGIMAFGKTSGKYKQGNSDWSDDDADAAISTTNPPLKIDTDPDTDPNPDYKGQNSPNSPGVDPNTVINSTPLNTPTLSTVGVFNRSFAMNAVQLKAFADWLYNADDDIYGEVIDGLRLMGENPMNGVVDVRLYPFNILDMVDDSGGELIKIGRTVSDVYGVKLSNSCNCVIDLGRCKFLAPFENFLDYEPYTTARLYIPYCGVVNINTAEFVGHDISAKLIVDIITGACVACIFVDDVLTITANGTCGVSIPITGTDSATYASQVLTHFAGAVSSVAGGLSGNIADAAGGVLSGGAELWKAMSVPVQYETKGSATPACENWLPQFAYFIVDKPKTAIPNNYGHHVGYACEISDTLNNFSGFTIVSNPDLSGIGATETEKEEIKRLLQEGVYL